MKSLTAALTLVLVACGHSENVEQGLSIASIPQGCARFYAPNGVPVSGWHQFGNTDATILWADAYQCGEREGRRCEYFIHNPDKVEINFKTDTRCVEE